ncbi:MAG: glycosyltransferase family 39 protein [Candidatus Omnitrophica bacterium]|nr:glycosyltransferase family 39 protein [Candidatus Omnitrophota bacterium]
MINKKYIFVTLFTLCLLAFGSTLFYPFVHDDFIYVENNPAIGDLSNIPGIFAETSILDNTSLRNPYYRPILEILYRLHYRIFGLNPFGYHLTNVLFHFLNSILIFFLLNLITQRAKLAGVIAVLFVVHPVQTEAVACVSGISNLFYTFFSLSSILLYLKAFQKKKAKPNWLYLLGALICYAIALFGKEQAIVMPLALVLYDLCFSGTHREGRVNRLLGKCLFFFCALQYLFWRKALLGNAIVPWTVISHGLGANILAVPRILLTYLGLIVFPQKLHYYRNIDLLDPVWASILLLGLVITGLLFLIRVMPKKNGQLMMFGLGWFLIFLLPVINLIPIVIEYSFVAVFEHFLYLPIVGILLACFVLAEFLIEKIIGSQKAHLFNPILVGSITMLCLILTFKQTTYWNGEIPLFKRTVKYEPEFGRAHVLLGRAYVKKDQCSKAIPEFQKALVIFENYRVSTKSPLLANLYSGLIRNVEEDLSICCQQSENSKAVKQTLSP